MSRPQKFRVGLKDGDRVLTEGVIDKNARYVFTHGYCSELMLALHEVTGWPMISAGVRDATLEQIAKFRAGHSGVLVPGGWVLDIEGPHDLDEWVGRWGPDPKVDERTFDPADAGWQFILASMDECRARSFAKPVLALAEDLI